MKVYLAIMKMALSSIKEKSFLEINILIEVMYIACEPIKFAEENSLLLCVRAPVGKLNITRRNVCIGRGLCAIKPYGNIRTDFLYYFLLTYEKYFTQNSTGSTFKAITSNVIFDCLFPLPSLDEQNKIIKTLEKVYSILK